jgi:hypothetical protein
MPDARQARENRAYVRRLLREKRPDFAAALELAVQELLCQPVGLMPDTASGAPRPVRTEHQPSGPQY